MLKECIVCSNKLAPDAALCGQCQTSDPFGETKRKKKYSRIFGAIIFTIGLVGFVYYVNKFGLLNYIR